MIGFRYGRKSWALISDGANVHPSAVVGSPPEHRGWWNERLDPQYVGSGECFHALIKDGARLGPFVNVDAGYVGNTVVGASWLMAFVHVAHDCVIGDNCEISPHSALMGHVEVGDNVRIGGGALIKPFMKIGDNARIGIGAVVTKDVPAGEVWAGNPAEPLDRLRRRRMLCQPPDEIGDGTEVLRMASQAEVRTRDYA